MELKVAKTILVNAYAMVYYVVNVDERKYNANEILPEIPWLNKSSMKNNPTATWTSMVSKLVTKRTRFTDPTCSRAPTVKSSQNMHIINI